MKGGVDCGNRDGKENCEIGSDCMWHDNNCIDLPIPNNRAIDVDYDSDDDSSDDSDDDSN